VNVDEVDDCLKNSFKTAGDINTDNILLYQDKLLAEVYGVSIHPAITINGQIYRGDLSGYDVFRAVCASFLAKDRPSSCSIKEELLKKLLINAEKKFVPPGISRNNARFWLILVLVLVLLINSTALIFYLRHKKRKMKLEI